MKNYHQPILKQDANSNVIQNSYTDAAFRGEYDVGDNLIYKGLARPGANEGDLVWQLALLDYDGSGNLLSITWPQAANGAASSEYNFSWTDRASYTYS